VTLSGPRNVAHSRARRRAIEIGEGGQDRVAQHQRRPHDGLRLSVPASAAQDGLADGYVARGWCTEAVSSLRALTLTLALVCASSPNMTLPDANDIISQ
jgi:hypothetical protein